MQCKGKLRCARCGGQHDYGKCEKEAKMKCNCGGEHSAAFGGCVVQREAREAQRVKVLSKVSYAEALKKVRETEANNQAPSGRVQRNLVQSGSNITESQVTNQSQVPVENKEDDSILVVKKVNCMVFICHTINVAAQLTKKSDRIKTIVQAAGKFLNIRDIKADQIH